MTDAEDALRRQEQAEDDAVHDELVAQEAAMDATWWEWWEDISPSDDPPRWRPDEPREAEGT